MTTIRRLALGALVLAGTLLASGCKDDKGGGTADVTINIVAAAATKGMAAFSAPSATVHVGNVVRMHNGDSVAHNIQPDSGGFPSWGSISAAGNASVTATTAGTFGYHCVVSGHVMTGTLVVQP
jgi:plastocyanin